MKILFWNCRGIGNTDTRSVLKKLNSSNRPDFLFLSEPWINFDDVPSSYWNQLGLKPFVFYDRHNSIPNIWGLCNAQFSPAVISTSSKQISFSVTVDTQMISFCV